MGGPLARLLAVALVYVALLGTQALGASMPQTPLTAKELNAILTNIMGRRVRVGYQGGGGAGIGHTPAAAAGGTANPNVGRIHLRPTWYKAIVNRRLDPDFFLGMGVLAHELGHHSEAGRGYTGTPNTTGGIDYDPAVPERIADDWARAHLAQVYRALGFRPALAKRSLKAFNKFRSENPY